MTWAAVGTGAATVAGGLVNKMMTKGGNTVITNPGDTSPLALILKNMQAQNDPAALAKMVGGIFQTGIQKDMPGILGNANTAGVRGGTASTTNLQQNDLLANLTANATAAISKVQGDTATAAANYSDQTKTQTVQQSSGGCFITTAICEGLGLGDDCIELRILRKWRDEVLASSEMGKVLIAEYYKQSPKLLKKLEGQVGGDSGVLLTLYDNYILPALNQIKQGKNMEALEIYINMLLTINEVIGE